MKKSHQYICRLCLGLLAILPLTVLAAISAQQASEIAQQHVPGRVLDVSPSRVQGRDVYQIKILNPRGEVHIILIDADSGERMQRR
ncbi:MAG: PepSY domain-containing protein [Gammaproteobacteria bacterium]